MATPTARPRIPTPVILLIGGAIIAVVYVLGRADSPSTTQPGTDGGGGYVDEYGGNPAVYQRIASTSDCDALQAEFDQASANNDAATPGTDQFRWSLGYMTAADDRMREVGCY